MLFAQDDFPVVLSPVAGETNVAGIHKALI